jgi:hypothetical protein
MIHDERVENRSHPAPRNPGQNPEWKIGCLGSMCFDPALSCEALFLHGCVAGHLKRNLSREGGPPGMDTTYCCSLFVACYILPCSYPCVLSVLSYNLRKEAANRWNIKEAKESCCDSCCLPFLCPLCNFCQLSAELSLRKESNGTWCSDASPNYTIEQWQNSHGNFGIRIMDGTAQQHLQTRSLQNAIKIEAHNDFVQSARLATFNSTHGSNNASNAMVFQQQQPQQAYPPQAAFYPQHQPQQSAQPHWGTVVAPPPPMPGAVNWTTQ